MEPIEFDVEFPRGDTCTLNFELTDESGLALDSSKSFEITMTARDASKNVVFQKKYSLGTIKVNEKNVSLVIEHKDTENLNIGGKYNYDIQFTSCDYYKTIYIGTITLTNEVTY